MKIFAFVDWHASMSAFKLMERVIAREQPDVIVNCGDFTVFEQHMLEVMRKLHSLTAKDRPMLMLHGNHEEARTVRKACSFFSNMVFMHKKVLEIKGYTFVGHGGGGFAQVDADFEHWSKVMDEQLLQGKLVLLTHAPFYHTKLDFLHGRFLGNKSYASFIKRHKNVVLGIAGHFHETAKKEDKVNNARVINPGGSGMLIQLP